MIVLRNDRDYNLTRLKILQGKITSVWAGDFFFNGVHTHPVLPFNYLTSNFTNFEKGLDEHIKMQYHLSGYGATFDEALRGFLGETAERYSFAVLSQFIRDRIVKKSYSYLINKFGIEYVFPFEYINVYYPEGAQNYIDKTDEILWVRMNSLVDPNCSFFAPLQLVISGGSYIYPEEKEYTLSAVSTGTACHETVLHALDNALIECLQIDSFELWWYGGFQGVPVVLDNQNFLKMYFNPDSVSQFLSNFSLSFTDITFDKCIPIYVCEIIGKKDGLPKYTVGVQGGSSQERTLYRCLMEALSVLEYNMGLPWIDHKRWNSVSSDIKNIKNFDDNVIKYAKYGKPHLQMKQSNFVSTKRCSSPLTYVKRNYPQSGYLVITAPEFQHLNLEVVRVCIPGLIVLSLPSYPPQYHPRFLSNEGISNYAAHPLA